MNTWGWIATYAVGLVVLQLLMYRYLARHSEGLSGTATAPGGEGEEESRPRTRLHAQPSERVMWTDQRGFDLNAGREASGRTTARICPYCGVENEPDRAFTRCRNCTGRLE